MVKNIRPAYNQKCKWLEQKLPAQIEWSAEEKKEGMECQEQPIDDQRWQLIKQIQQEYREGLCVKHMLKSMK